MRIEKPYRPQDKHAQVTLNGVPINLGATPVFACDDQEGWVDFAELKGPSKAPFRFVIGDDGQPVIRREHGAVTIAFPTIP